MFQQIILPKFNNKLEEQLINLFHSSNLPLHYQKTLRFCFGVFEFPKKYACKPTATSKNSLKYCLGFLCSKNTDDKKSFLNKEIVGQFLSFQFSDRDKQSINSN